MYESGQAYNTDVNCNITWPVQETHAPRTNSLQVNIHETDDALFKASYVKQTFTNRNFKWWDVWRNLWELHRYPTMTGTLSSIEKAPKNQRWKNRGQESWEYWTTEVFQLALHASGRKHKPSNLLLNKAFRETWSISWRSTEKPR